MEGRVTWVKSKTVKIDTKKAKQGFLSKFEERQKSEQLENKPLFAINDDDKQEEEEKLDVDSEAHEEN